MVTAQHPIAAIVPVDANRSHASGQPHEATSFQCRRGSARIRNTRRFPPLSNRATPTLEGASAARELGRSARSRKTTSMVLLYDTPRRSCIPKGREKVCDWPQARCDGSP